MKTPQTSKICNEVVESGDQIPMSEEYPIGGIKGKTIQGANSEYVKITKKDCIYIPIFV